MDIRIHIDITNIEGSDMAPIDDVNTLATTLGTVIVNILAAAQKLPAGGATAAQVQALKDTLTTELATAQQALTDLSGGTTTPVATIGTDLATVASALAALPTTGDATDAQVATFDAGVNPALAEAVTALATITPVTQPVTDLGSALSQLRSLVAAVPTSGGVPAASLAAFVTAATGQLQAAGTALAAIGTTASASRVRRA